MNASPETRDFHLNDTTHRLVVGDSRHMAAVGDETVDFVVTSPPYWSLKDYGHGEQIGHEQAYADYLDDLQQVMGECLRALRPGCRMALNIGDQYLRASEHGRYRIQSIPADLTLRGQALGFDFMGNIIWRKISTTRTTGGGALMGSIHLPKDGHITYEHESILIFRKQGKWRKPSAEVCGKSLLTKEQRSSWFRGVWDDISPTRQKGHVAMFPVALPERLIRMYSFWGETVLDPFLGSGTTSLAAAQAGRNSIGYEINPQFVPVIEEKLSRAAAVS